MELVQGDLWDELGRAQLLLVTTNAVLDSRGWLVMGAGAALQAKQRIPRLPSILGHQAKVRGFVQPDGRFQYHLLPGDQQPSGTWVGAFQTKYHWRDPSDLFLVSDSASYLARIAARFDRIALNLPGVGLGGLPRTHVLRMLECKLPDNVYVYERG